MPIVTSKVTLLEYTQNPEKTVATAARLCYSGSGIGTLRDGMSESEVKKLIGKIVKLGHLSCLEHAAFTFGIEGVSRAFLAQITRHRIASFSVQSQRYVSCREMNYILPPPIEELGQAAVKEYERQMETAAAWYKEWQRQLGGEGEAANEDARFVLPSAAETKMILTMNARELRHFFALRCCARAQWEIRAVAQKMLAAVQAVAPALFAAAGAPCVSGPCPEGEKGCGKQ